MIVGTRRIVPKLPSDAVCELISQASTGPTSAIARRAFTLARTVQLVNGGMRSSRRVASKGTCFGSSVSSGSAAAARSDVVVEGAVTEDDLADEAEPERLALPTAHAVAPTRARGPAGRTR